MSFPDKKSFYISVKALCFNEQGELLLIRTHENLWSVPGGKIEDGESFEEALRRECIEEMNIEPEILDEQPYISYATHDRGHNARLMIFFRVKFPHLNLVPSEEAQEIEFRKPSDVDPDDTFPQLRPLFERLSKSQN